ncbi:BTB/POZ protein [Aspergillus crustosus]
MVGKKKNRKISQSSVATDPEHDPQPSNRPDGKAHEYLLDLIASLHLNSDYSDIKIVCKGRTLPAHKLVVCSRSEYFKRACFGGFKETQEPICLDNTDPVLIERVLEFLYTGKYTLGHLTPEARDPQLDSDTERANESLITSTSEGHAPNQLASNEEEAAGEIIEHSSKNTAQDPLDENYPSDQEGAMDPNIDPWAKCHPCYFHMRIFGEADYFMINDLKDIAKEQFCTSFMECSERDLFAEIIKELYSDRANYQGLRTLAIEVVVNNLPSLRKGFSPVIDSELLEVVPNFAVDLCLATMDKYVSEPPNMKPYPFATGFEYSGVDYKFQPLGSTNWSY